MCVCVCVCVCARVCVCVCVCVCVRESVHFYSAAMCMYGQASALIASVGVCESIVTYMQPFDRSGRGVEGNSAHPALMTTAES